MFTWIKSETVTGNKINSYRSSEGIELGHYEKTGRGIRVTINNKTGFDPIQFFVIRPKDAEHAIKAHEINENPLVQYAQAYSQTTKDLEDFIN